MEAKAKGSVFETLNAVNCNEHTEKKNDLTYLSWAWAWAEVKKRFPNADYEVVKNEKGLPYFYDEASGIMCYTKVTIDGVTHEMWLPVMDSSNRAMRFVPTKYMAWNKFQKKFEEKEIAAATMFDVNKTVMRCLTKNLAMFGLGLYIYAGEDLPEEVSEDAPAAPAATAKKVIAKKPASQEEQLTEAINFLKEALGLQEIPNTAQGIAGLWTSNVDKQSDPLFKNAIQFAGSYYKNKAA